MRNTLRTAEKDFLPFTLEPHNFNDVAVCVDVTSATAEDMRAFARMVHKLGEIDAETHRNWLEFLHHLRLASGEQVNFLALCRFIYRTRRQEGAPLSSIKSMRDMLRLIERANIARRLGEDLDAEETV